MEVEQVRINRKRKFDEDDGELFTLDVNLLKGSPDFSQGVKFQIHPNASSVIY